MRVGIIGGGAAGMAAAIKLVQSGLTCTLFDANPYLGRKLKATGSGRCNISNRNANSSVYFSDDQQAVETSFASLSTDAVEDFLNAIGIPLTSTEDGWLYPLSFSAANVVQIMQDNVHSNAIEVNMNSMITSIQKHEDEFILETEEKGKQFIFDRILIACGSPANPQLGARNELEEQLELLGHDFLPFRPALAPVETETEIIHKLQGVRLDVKVTLRVKRKEIANSLGNVIFTKWGLNGPGVMNISHHIDPYKQFELVLDLIPHISEKLRQRLKNPDTSHLSIHSLLDAFLPDKVTLFALKKASVNPKTEVGKLSTAQKESIVNTLQNVHIKAKEVRGFKHAQAATGGIPFAEINSGTMESKICPQLYFAGEIINVLGPCGGYNLHWAIHSALVAAQAIAGEEPRSK